MAKIHDIAVLGATAAGYASALALAKRHDVVLLDGPKTAAECPLADWVPADVVAECGALRAVKTSGTDGPFRGVAFHRLRTGGQTAYRSRSIAGYVLRSSKLLGALRSAAKKAGLRHVRFPAPATVELHEPYVAVHAGREIRARLLLIAEGTPADAARRLSMPVRAMSGTSMTCCGLDVPVSAAQRRKLDKDLHVVGLAEPDRLGVFFVAGAVLHVRLVCAGERLADRPAIDALGRLVASLQSAGLLGERLNLARAQAGLWRPPGGAALELETHLAKRTLLVGTAGGFASALTGQTLAPGVLSAAVAAEVAHRALDSDHPQDVLAEYENLWRDRLADRIRQPGTSIRMLMPMVMTNRAMTTRFARALLYGESI